MSSSTLSLMVCVDGSREAHTAFECALTLCKRQAAGSVRLLLLAVCESLTMSFPVAGAPAMYTVHEQQHHQHEMETRYRQLLASYALRCRDEQVACKSILGTSSQIGEFICQMAVKYRADMVVMGRRGLGRFSRLLMGSVSDHVMQHCKANVLLARSSMASEIHVPTSSVVRMEEQERERRIHETNPQQISEFRQSLNQNIQQLSQAVEQRKQKLTQEGGQIPGDSDVWFDVVREQIQQDATHASRQEHHQNLARQIEVEYLATRV